MQVCIVFVSYSYSKYSPLVAENLPPPVLTILNLLHRGYNPPKSKAYSVSILWLQRVAYYM